VNLIQCCKAMKIQRYIFFSIKDCDKHTDIPLMQLKYLTENLLRKSKIRFTTLRLTGFMQPLVSQYALQVLNDQTVWSDGGEGSGVAYLDSQDCARMAAAVLNRDETIGRTLLLSGPKTWTTPDVIKLCEDLSGRTADVNNVPTLVVKATQAATGFFMWTRDIAERLRFVEVTESAGGDKLMSAETYELLGMDPSSTRTLEKYFGEYYKRVFKKLAGEEQPEEEKETAPATPPPKSNASAGPSEVAADVMPEEEVTVEFQEDIARQLEKYYLDRDIDSAEGPENEWFGMSPIAENVNGRSAMFGLAIGIFTEYASGQSIPAQVDLFFDNISPRT